MVTVAVITRTKNRPLLLRRACRSVLGETFADWAHVIVNDGGSSQVVDEVVREFEAEYDGRLSVIHNPESVGMEAASNIGIRASQSKFIVIHDDDDTWKPNFLERCIDELEKCQFPSVKGVLSLTTQVFERIENGAVVEERRQSYDPNLSAITLPEISEINRFLPISFLFERSVIDEIGPFDESLPVIGDWEFNIRFFSKFDVLVVREHLANYHVRVAAEPDYENTVTAGQAAHQFHRSLIVNKLIRDDIREGKISKAKLMMFGDYFHRSSSGTARIAKFLDRLKNRPMISKIRKILKI